MVIDTIDNLKRYVAMNALFADVVDFLQHNKLEDLSEGKHPIKGDDVFVNIQAKEGKTADEAVIEYHRRMIDIQVPLNATETFGYTPVADLPEADFNADKDIAKLPGVKPQTFVTVKPGQMAIFFPQDGHAPCISDAGQLRKAIFKIKAL
jgi:YhcH/YjgK/YiaL family protein